MNTPINDHPRFDLEAYAYPLPPERIAQEPAEPRDASRLAVLRRDAHGLEHATFRDLPRFLNPGDLLVLNDTRVIAARVFGRRRTGARVEVFFLKPLPGGQWEALTRCNSRLNPGEEIALAQGQVAQDGQRPDHNVSPEKVIVKLLEHQPDGSWIVQAPGPDFMRRLDEIGAVPLPPYIHRQTHDPRDTADRQRYQTIYAAQPGAVAAPTAGLHFTQRVFDELAAKGVQKTCVTLHVGAGTFRPISTPDIRQHPMHTETYSVSQNAIDAIRAAQQQGRRVIPVGTTACRVLETLARRGWPPGPGETAIYLYPTCPFLAASALITNFHLPHSTLLVLVSALAGRQRILDAYAQCASLGYRFYSYGDAMLIQ